MFIRYSHGAVRYLPKNIQRRARALYSLELLFKICVGGRLRRARVTYSGAVQVQRGGGPRVDCTVDAFGEKLWWRQRPGAGPFPKPELGPMAETGAICHARSCPADPLAGGP